MLHFTDNIYSFSHTRTGPVRCVLPCQGKFGVLRFWPKLWNPESLLLYLCCLLSSKYVLLAFLKELDFFVKCIHLMESAIESKSHSLSQKVQMTWWSCELIWNFSYINPSPHFILGSALGTGVRGTFFITINIIPA